MPILLKRLQFANNPKEILSTFIKNKTFQDKQAEKKRQAAARALEQKALAEKRQQEQQALEEKAHAEQRQKEEMRLLQEQAAVRQAKQKALQERALREKRERAIKQEKKLLSKEERQKSIEYGKKLRKGQSWGNEKWINGWVIEFGARISKFYWFLVIITFLGIALRYILPSINKIDSAEKIETFNNKPTKDILPSIILNIEKNMKSIPSGTFTMGCTSEQSDCDDNEKPTHQVSISSFKMNKYEVTQEEWQAVMGKNPSYFSDCDKCPVEQVSWEDIQDFLKKLNELTGKNYCLPSEAEWEYAARGNENYKYAGSNDINLVAWYNSNSGDKTHVVGGKKANGFGLYDMSGNVWEWCHDTWHKDYNGAPTDGRAWTGSSSDCIYRGGSWNSDAWNSRVASRYRISSGNRYSYIGFRLAHR